MPLTRLDNLYSSKTGKYLYVSPDDFNATDELDNRGNSPLRPFKTIQRAFIEVSRYSYLPGTNNDRFDQFSIMLMPGNHYIDNRPGLVTEVDVEQRYFDASNLLRANRQEVIDRAVAQVAVDHPDFYYPGDPQTGEWSRYKDSYRLIQKNREEIIDRAVAKISVDHPDFYYPQDAQTGEWSRYKDAYRLIQRNRDLIAQDAFDYMNGLVPPNPLPDNYATKCIRDIGFLIDAISLDVHQGGGNKYTRKFVQNYFNEAGTDWVDAGLRGEENSSLFAFGHALDLMKEAITNRYTSTSAPGSEYKDLTVTAGDPTYNDGTGTVTNTDENACSDVQTYMDNLYAIVPVVMNNADLAANNGNFLLSDVLPAEVVSDIIPDGEAKCKRDTGLFIDALALDVHAAGGNVYTRKLAQNYFDSTGNNWVVNGLQGETAESITAFNEAVAKMQMAVTNQLFTYKDLTLTEGDAVYGTTNPQENLPSGNPAACADVQTLIANLGSIITTVVSDENLGNLPDETTSDLIPAGEVKCKRDAGYIVDGLVDDLGTEGNANTITNAKAYFDRFGNPISNGLLGEEAESVTAFKAIGTWAKAAVTNTLFAKDLTISEGPAYAGANTAVIPYAGSGNIATCQDVQATIDTLVKILTDVIEVGNLDNLADIKVTGVLPSFNYNRALEEWQDNSIVDLANPDNVLYKFNAATGGCIVPRGCSLIGYDLRRTVVRPLYVPDPADTTQARTSIFNLTGGCYLWQFTIKDGDLSAQSPLYDASAGVGKVYFKKGSTDLAIPEYSHHKICIMEYADKSDLDNYYDKVGKAFQQFQTDIDEGGLEALVQENRIVGPLSDSRTIESMKVDDSTTFVGNASNSTVLSNVINASELEVGYEITSTDVNAVVPPNTRIDSIAGTTVTLSQAISGSGAINFTASFGYTKITVTTKIDHGYFESQYVAIINSGLSDEINGTWKVTEIDQDNPKVFKYEVFNTAAGLGLVTGQTYLSGEVGGVSTNAVVLAEIDSVESASPYVFNCSIRSTWGQCGMWADGSKATGFKSMVVAQYTGVSLQKDDRAFIRYDRLTNTWNQASLTDAFATIPYHTKGDAYWKDDWRNFHIRASDDSFIQCVSVFAVGFFDHFLMESGGDMSITNSNSNFGNTSLHSVGFKGFSFNQDKGGYITDIVPPETINENNIAINQWYTLDVDGSNSRSNHTKVYLAGDNLDDPENRPATSINGYRIGARSQERLYVTLDRYPAEPTGPNEFSSLLSPNGFKSWNVGIETLTPSSANVDNYAQDSANLIEANKEFIQSEAYQYILQKYPALALKETINISKCERDIGYFVDAVVNDLRLGGNINSIQAAEGYFIGGNVAYVSGELNETIDALDYVKNIMIAAMRNFDYLVRDAEIVEDSAIVTVPSTEGILVGMTVREYALADFTNGKLNAGATPIGTNIPTNNVFVKQIISDTQIELGVAGAKLSSGPTQPAIGSNPSAYLYFEMEASGGWTSILVSTDDTITQDSQLDEFGNPLPECQNIATTIAGYFEQIFLILNEGYTILGGREADAYNAIIANKRFIAAEAVYRVANDPAYAGTKLGQGLLASTGETIQDACVDDIENTLAAIAYNIKFGGNNQVFDAATLYLTGAHVAGEEAESIAAFNIARDLAIEAMRQQTIAIQGDHGLTQTIDTNVAPEYDANGALVTPPCADIATAITTLTAIVTGAINGTAPGTKTLPSFSTVTRVDPTSDLSGLASRATLFTLATGNVGGNPNPHDLETGTPVRLVPKPVAGQNPDKRVIRLPNGFNTNTKYYVIAPGRNLYPENFALSNQVITVTEAAGTSLTASNPTRAGAAGVYRSLVAQPKIDTDGTALASGTGLRFNITVNADGSIELGSTALSLDAIANGGSRYQQGDIVVISDAQIGGQGAADLEIEITAVTTAEYPGVFDSSATNKLMLATSPENAAAGIYMYSPETDSVDPDVQIELQSFVLDNNYDLHKFKCNVVGASEIESSVAHIFDVPSANTTSQRVFVRVANGIQGSSLPELSGTSATISTQTLYYVRYVSNKRFTLHTTAADAESGDRALTFVSGTGVNFFVFADKRESPIRFDPEFTSDVNSTGLWYVNVEDESSIGSTGYNRYSILSRFHGGAEEADDYQTKTDPTLDTRYLRIEDGREKEDRVYRMRYVIPNYLETVRDPLNGFVLKTRTDDKRRLVPQRLLLRPIQGNPNTVASFYNPAGAGEQIGLTKSELIADQIRTIDPSVVDLLPEQQNLYDPYVSPKVLEFDSKIAGTIQSARKIIPPGESEEFLEVTLFDHTIVNQSVKNEIFTLVSVSNIQGGNFTANSTQSVPANRITWEVIEGSNKSSGSAYIQAVLDDITNSVKTLVLKNVEGIIEWNSNSTVQFKQSFPPAGNATTTDGGGNTIVLAEGDIIGRLVATPNSFGDPDIGLGLDGGKDKSLRENYLYRVEGANVYTAGYGDTITDDAGNGYYIADINDQGDFDDTFYIFDIDTLQERIPNQQDGIYYLTCIRGNISPFPTGSGVGENFRNFKFSQPISQLYPINYKNDPLWFQYDGLTGTRDTSILDVPQTYSAADNYVHGLVTVNDAKGSETKEGIEDIIKTSALNYFTYTNNTTDSNGDIIDNRIRAQEGNATSGSEDRLIPISGDSQFPTERKLYLELRRPSIARSGNHTFEYLGFGPGNYSTGFPLRQEVVLTDKQDFYAQAKREDGGIVFYTGLNSNGDLYIGNKKVNAITGEETFLESAELLDSEDEDEDIGSLVTTFDSPVTFNNTITVAGKATLNGPVEINVEPAEGDALRVQSKIETGDDPTLFRGSWRNVVDGDIVIAENRIKSAVFILNARPKIGGEAGQSYSFRTNYLAGEPSNIVPWQPEGQQFYASQKVEYGAGNAPQPGDILFKGSSVNRSGSLGWIYSNQYNSIESQVFNITTDGSLNLTVNWIATVTNASAGVGVNTKIRVVNFSNPVVNGTWNVRADGFDPNGTSFQFTIANALTTGITYSWADEGTGADILASASNWKEVGVLGAEAIRTITDVRGDLRLGVNTIARANHAAVLTGNVDEFTDPRANLDVVGTAFISGKTLATYNASGDLTDNRYDDHDLNSDQREALTGTNLANQGFIPQDNALLVGGDSNDLEREATLRVSTSDVTTPVTSTYVNGGRLGINTTLGLTSERELDRNFVVVGDGRITGNFLISDDISVDGGDINTTAGTFNFINDNATILNMFGDGQLINIANNTTNDQSISIGGSTQNQVLRIGANAGTTLFSVHPQATNATVDIASVNDAATNACEVAIGGAYENTNSSTLLGTRQTIVAGTLEIGYNIAAGTGTARLFSQTKIARLFDDDRTTEVNAFLSANNLNLASLGGSTTIRNALNVQASLRADSNIILNGGTSAGIIEITRGRFSTTPILHNTGSLDTPNIDFYKYNTTGRVIDTAGVTQWGGNQFLQGGGQISGFDNVNTSDPSGLRVSGNYNFVFPTGGSGAGAAFDVNVAFDGTVTLTIVSTGTGYNDNELLTILDSSIGGGGAPNITLQINGVNDPGDVYILPISTPDATDFDIGDLLLIDRGNPASPDSVTVQGGGSITGLRDQAKSEIVRVVGLTNLTNPEDSEGFRLAVRRAQEGTGNPSTGEGWTDHPDGCIIAKLNKQAAASFITGVDGNNDDVLDEPRTGFGAGTTNVRMGVAEFGGVLTTQDFLRLSQSEFVGIADIISADVQVLQVNDGGDPAVVQFQVDSTTGDTILSGDLGVGQGYNKLTVNGDNGNTNIAGTLTVENTITLNGSTLPGNEFFTITNGGSDTVALRTTFQIDSATGNVTMNGGNINIFGTDGTTPRLTFNNASGDFTTYGSFSALGDGTSTFGGPVEIAGDLEVNGGDLVVNSNGTEVFAVDDDGSVNIAGITNYFSPTGGRKWEYSAESVINGEANVNYFLNVSGNTIFKLPASAQMGDMIRIIDIGGTLTYNQSLVVRAPSLVSVQGTTSNTGGAMLGGVPTSQYTSTHSGGELVVQTPNAAFALVYAGTSTADGNPGAPASKAGWYLIEV
ncbi:tail protein [Synechococcus phage S-H9-2]|uniref:Tail protein n=1 Tax=Synechococcus phage S-H9-2 TaxID=2783669 RepID=A0A873WHK8_9CAUD|nr:virion structural protein [Synechococcus phage S-H9-2]QPB08452.1 tail protein [Synechococcus phage S-H9-2]